MPAIWRAWKSSKHCSGVNDMAEQHGKALVPQIRFAGFTDPWEQRKAIEDMTMSVPSVAEQASIGAFFDRLDSLITPSSA